MNLMRDLGYVGFSMASTIFGMAMLIFVFIGYWRIFEKAGKPGWAVIIPIYNVYCAFSIAWGSGWMFLLMLIPFVNIIVGIMTCLKAIGGLWKGISLCSGPYVPSDDICNDPRLGRSRIPWTEKIVCRSLTAQHEYGLCADSISL